MLCKSNWTAGSSRAMPELPEVESLRRILVRTAVGRTIVKVRIGEKRLRQRVTADFSGAIVGRRIVKLSRRAKYLFIQFAGQPSLLSHPGWRAPPRPPPPSFIQH